MFGIGGGEFIFILFMILLFFGSDKIPEMARTFGKFMAQVKNATNDIKTEIHKTGVDTTIADEVTKAKEGFTKMLTEAEKEAGMESELHKVADTLTKADQEIAEATQKAIDQVPDDYSGPLKRNR